MDNVQLIGTQTQRVMQRRLEAAANNLANLSTAGFKADVLVTREYESDPARAEERPHDVRFVRDYGFARDLRQGDVTRTDSPFDLAISGDGFFTVGGPNGPAYTRDGAFTLDDRGQLVTKDGFPVLGEGGAPIVLDPKGPSPSIDASGVVKVGETEVGRLALVSFDKPEALDKEGSSLWNQGSASPVAFTGKVEQGALEHSNVNPILELTRVIEISRAYESAARFVRNGDDLRQRALERLGKL